MWLSLIFIKTHLKDKNLRLHRDLRLPDDKIADLYTWSDLHHIHCVARSVYTGCSIDPKVHGSFLVLPAKLEKFYDPFDYGDLSFARTVLLKLGDVAFLAVLDDSCAAWTHGRPVWQRIAGRLSPLQLRELAAQFAYVNLNLKDRPRYQTETDYDGGSKMSAVLPEKVRLEEPRAVTYGTVLYACCKEILLGIQNPDKEDIIEHVKQGKWSTLFDSEERFIHNSMEPVPFPPAEK